VLGIWQLLVLAGCGSAPSAEDEARAHFRAVYGEDFVFTEVTKTTGVYGEPKPFDRTYRYVAHPVAHPALEVKGLVSFGFPWGSEVTDDYRCAQVRSWLPDHLRRGVGPRRLMPRLEVACSRDRLPPHPAPGQPLPAGSVMVKGELLDFRAGDPTSVVVDARRDLREVADAVGARVGPGMVGAYEPEAWAAVASWVRPERPSHAPAPWDALLVAYAEGRNDEAPVELSRDQALEASVMAVVGRLHPGARVGVRARPMENTTSPWRVVDVRLTEAGLTQVAVEGLADALEGPLRGHRWALTGVDSEAEPARGRRCWSGLCWPTGQGLVAPEVLSGG